MSICPKCSAPMTVKDDKMVCTRETCGYMHDLVTLIPSQAKLWEENKSLNELIIRCQKYIEDAIEYVGHGEHVITKEGKALLIDILAIRKP